MNTTVYQPSIQRNWKSSTLCGRLQVCLYCGSWFLFFSCILVKAVKTQCLPFQTSSVSSPGLKTCLTCQSSPTSKQFKAEHFTGEQLFFFSLFWQCCCFSLTNVMLLSCWCICIWDSSGMNLIYVLYFCIPLVYILFTTFRGVSSRRYSTYFTCPSLFDLVWFFSSQYIFLNYY